MLDKHSLEILRAVGEDLQDYTLEEFLQDYTLEENDTGPHTVNADLIKVIDQVAVLVPLLSLLARGELTIEQFLQGLGAPMPIFEVKVSRLHTHTESGEVIYHVPAWSAATARALVEDEGGSDSIMGSFLFEEVVEERMRGDDETDETETIDSVEVLQERVATGQWFLSRDFADMTDSPLSDGSAVVWICSDGCAARVPDRVVRTGGRTMDTAGIVCVVCGSVENESGGSDV